jgi:ABC-type lipoprotein release transport system permease subunit
MEIIIGILVAAGIFNTLFVSVMERRREFGIMMAIGYSPGQLFRLVMAESAWVAAAGLVLSGVVTAYPYYYFNTVGLDISTMIGKQGGVIEGISLEPIIKVAIYPENLGLIVLAVFITTLLAGLYPAWKAGRISPVDSIKLV